MGIKLFWFLHALVVFWVILFNWLYPMPVSPGPLQASVSNDDLVSYTPRLLGSVQNTDKPFCVGITHAGVIKWIHWSAPSTQFIKGDKILTIDGAPFSIAVWDRAFTQPSRTQVFLTFLRDKQVIETSVFIW